MSSHSNSISWVERCTGFDSFIASSSKALEFRQIARACVFVSLVVRCSFEARRNNGKLIKYKMMRFSRRSASISFALVLIINGLQALSMNLDNNQTTINRIQSASGVKKFEDYHVPKGKDKLFSEFFVAAVDVVAGVSQFPRWKCSKWVSIESKSIKQFIWKKGFVRLSVCLIWFPQFVRSFPRWAMMLGYLSMRSQFPCQRFMRMVL